jgi:hypothetical protein
MPGQQTASAVPEHPAGALASGKDVLRYEGDFSHLLQPPRGGIMACNVGTQLQLEQWANFYVVTSATAATLLGLQFVVITLGSAQKSRDARKVRIYLTPVIICFSSVLLTSALLAIPNQTTLSTVICLYLVGIAGLVYSSSLAVRRDGNTPSYESRAHLFPYAFIPFAANALMLVGGLLLLLAAPPIGLDFVAAGLLLLLGIGIRNSWAIAVDIVSSQDSV